MRFIFFGLLLPSLCAAAATAADADAQMCSSSDSAPELPFSYRTAFSPKSVRHALDFAYTANDVVLSTYPKSGTTWTQQIMHQVRGQKRDFDGEDVSTWNPMIECMLDLYDNNSYINDLDFTYNVYKFHLRPSHGPSAPRVVYVMRNAPDVYASWYKFAKKFSDVDTWEFGFGYQADESPPTKIDFFKDLIPGEKALYGSWAEHVADALRLKKSNPDRIFIAKFEHWKTNLSGNLDALAMFLNRRPLSDEERIEVETRTSFDFMKENEAHFLGSAYIKKHMGFELDGSTIAEGKTGAGENVVDDEFKTLHTAFFQKHITQEFGYGSYEEIASDTKC